MGHDEVRLTDGLIVCTEKKTVSGYSGYTVSDTHIPNQGRVTPNTHCTECFGSGCSAATLCHLCCSQGKEKRHE